jgi:hypothetical protein
MRKSESLGSLKLGFAIFVPLVNDTAEGRLYKVIIKMKCTARDLYKTNDPLYFLVSPSICASSKCEVDKENLYFCKTVI